MTGTELSRTGSSAAHQPSLPTETARPADPIATDRNLLAKLKRSHGLHVEWRAMFPENRETYHRVEKISLPSTTTPEMLGKAIAEVEAACVAISSTEALKLLAELKTLTKARAEDETDLEATAIAYAKRVMEYPADVVRKVVAAMPNRQIFWPAWAELREALEDASRTRKGLLHALKTWRAPQAKLNAPRATPEQIDKVMAKFRKTLAERKATSETSQRSSTNATNSNPPLDMTPAEIEARKAEWNRAAGEAA